MLIPVEWAVIHRGHHLDVLGAKDMAFIAWNKFTTTIFTYHTIRYCWTSKNVKWVSIQLWVNLCRRG